MIPIGSVVTIHPTTHSDYYFVLDVFDNSGGEDPLLFPRCLYYKLSKTGTYWPENRLTIAEGIMYLVTPSKDGTHFVGDFVPADKFVQEDKCAYYDFVKQAIVYIGKFSEDEKRQVERILLLQ